MVGAVHGGGIFALICPTMRALIAILAAGLLGGCVPPGITYSIPVKTAANTGKADVERVRSVPVMKIGSNVNGDQTVRIAANGVSIVHEIKTPRNLDGSIAWESVPILNKDRTAVLGYHARPIVASVDTVSVIAAWGDFGRKLFSGLNNMLGTVFMGLTGIETAKQAGAATAAAVEVVKP